MKDRYDGSIDYLKEKYPNIEYVGGSLYIGEEEVLASADELLEEYFDGGYIIVSDSSGDPQLEREVRVDGKEFIKHTFGSYESAYNSI